MYIGIGFICALVFRFLLQKENAARERGDRDEVIESTGVDEKGVARGHERNGRFVSVEEAKREKGDEWSGYRYTL
jgi:hypothetical protein